MKTVLVQINNQKAYRLLEDLQELNLIKMLSGGNTTNKKLSEKYAGKLPTDVADQIQDFVTQSRSEWNSRNI